MGLDLKTKENTDFFVKKEKQAGKILDNLIQDMEKPHFVLCGIGDIPDLSAVYFLNRAENLHGSVTVVDLMSIRVNLNYLMKNYEIEGIPLSKNYNCVIGDMSELDALLQEPADIIFYHNSIKHTEEIEKTVESSLKTLNKNGALAFTLLDYKNPQGFYKIFQDRNDKLRALAEKSNIAVIISGLDNTYQCEIKPDQELNSQINYYFEEGRLSKPKNFEETPLPEKKEGFARDFKFGEYKASWVDFKPIEEQEEIIELKPDYRCNTMVVFRP